MSKAQNHFLSLISHSSGAVRKARKRINVFNTWEVGCPKINAILGHPTS
jgi:hypothetical protein